MSAASEDVGLDAFLARHRDVVVVAVLMTSAALGLSSLGAESLWFDEAWTVELAARPVSEQLREYLTTNAEGGPVYHVLLHYWMQLFGKSEFAVRAISAIAQVGAVAIAFVLMRRLAGEAAAGIGSMLVATSPALVYFSQEARNYSLLVFLFLLSLWLFVLYLESSRGGLLGALGAVNFIGLSTHTLMIEVILVESVAILVAAASRPAGDARALLVRFIGVHCVVAVALVPHLLLVSDAAAKAVWVPPPSLASGLNAALLYTGARFFENPFRARSFGAEGLSVIEIAHAVAMAMLAAVGAVHLARRGFDASAQTAELAQRRTTAVLVLGLVVLVPGVPFLLSLGGASYFIPRYLIMGVPAFAMLVAVGAARCFQKRTVLAVVVACLAGLALSVAIPDLRAQTKDNWRRAGEIVGSRIKPQATLIVSDGRGKVPFDYYYRGPVEALAIPAELGRNPRDPELAKMRKRLERSPGGIWLVMPWGGDDGRERVGMWTWFEANRSRYRLVAHWRAAGSWGGVLIHRYARRSAGG